MPEKKSLLAASKRFVSSLGVPSEKTDKLAESIVQLSIDLDQWSKEFEEYCKKIGENRLNK